MSHFSLTNSLYDKCNLDKKDQESSGPFKYMTEPLYENKNSCHMTSSPYMHNQFHSIPGVNVDAENDLRNQTRHLSRCPSTRFDPTKAKNCAKCTKCNSGLPCGCSHCKETKYNSQMQDCKDQGLVPSYTRINKPCNIFSGITINRFHPLCEDLQDSLKIQSNSYIGANTRLNVKDAFKPEQIKLTSEMKSATPASLLQTPSAFPANGAPYSKIYYTL